MESYDHISQHVFAVASGKGGVGKSTIAVNLLSGSWMQTSTAPISPG